MLPSMDEAKEIWENRDQIIDNHSVMFLAMITELNYGNILSRPWGVWFSEDDRLIVAASGMSKVLGFIFQMDTFNRDQVPIIKGLSYIFQCLLKFNGVDFTYKILINSFEYINPKTKYPFEFRLLIAVPILNAILDDISTACSIDCDKVYTIENAKNEKEYFKRFYSSHKKEEDERVLVVYNNDMKCKLDLVSKKENCPLFTEIDYDGTNKKSIMEVLNFIKMVLDHKNYSYV